MNFKPYLKKQAHEVIFSQNKAISHPPLELNNNNVIQVNPKNILVSFLILDCLLKNIWKQWYVKLTKL